MDYTAFRALRDPIEARLNVAGAALKAVPGIGSGQMGLTPDDVRARPDYQAANRAYNGASAALRAFDNAFKRAHRKTWPVYFKAELRAESDARRADVLAGRRQTLTGA